MANVIVGRKSGFIRRSGSMVRQTKWVGIAPTNTNLPAANTVVLFAGFPAAILEQRPFTIVRTRLAFHVRSDQRAVTEIYQAALGISVVSDQAQAIGVTAVPTPFTDISSDLFFYWETILGQVSVTSDIGVFQTGNINYGDSKAMRKVDDGADVAIAIEASGVSSGCDVTKLGRMLIKLH